MSGIQDGWVGPNPITKPSMTCQTEIQTHRGTAFGTGGATNDADSDGVRNGSVPTILPAF